MASTTIKAKKTKKVVDYNPKYKIAMNSYDIKEQLNNQKSKRRDKYSKQRISK